MIKIGDLVKQQRNIDNINVEFYGKVSKIEKIKSKLVDENGLSSSELSSTAKYVRVYTKFL